MKQNYLVFKNKNSLLCCILLAITVGIIMLGLSIVISIEHDWNNWNKNDILFRTYSINNELNENDVKKLKELDEIQDVISNKEYEIIATNTFLEDNSNSNMNIKGMPKEDLEKLTDADLNGSYIICSNKFKPSNATIFYNNIDFINLNDFVNKDIELKFNSRTNNEKVKLIDLYNSELFYSSDNICYTSYENVLNLNKKYYKDEDNKQYYVIASKNTSANKIGDILKENGYSFNNISYMNINNKEKIVNYTFWITIVIGILMLFVTYIFIIKNRNKYRKDEIFMQGLIAYALAIVISFTGFLIFEDYVLAKNTLFARMDMTYSYIALIIGVLITFVMPMSVNIQMKKEKEK